uniref:Uncharacterized protein n=1 Tax=Trypanosoma vivax (strain Y486) TaxID=1055687 RepID=G0UC61_TRYVY|nr:hypothetical protein TVY486_1108930 [Trypanosoma vivax Y486]
MHWTTNSEECPANGNITNKRCNALTISVLLPNRQAVLYNFSQGTKQGFLSDRFTAMFSLFFVFIVFFPPSTSYGSQSPPTRLPAMSLPPRHARFPHLCSFFLPFFQHYHSHANFHFLACFCCCEEATSLSTHTISEHSVATPY